MRSAFDHIDDPDDPAWSGHAVEPAESRRRWVVAAVVVLVLVAAGMLVAVARGGDGDDPAGAERSSRVLPSAVVPEATDGTVPTVDPDAGTAAASDGVPVDPLPESGSAAAADPGAGTGVARGDSPSSGWAPVQATKPHWSAEWLEGDLVGIAPVVADRLEVVARSLGVRIEVISGWRSNHEQNELYQRYLSGTGNLAAPPGLSKHESGMAADAYVDGVALANVDGAVAAARAAGLHFPVGGEPWHAELID